MFSLSLFAPDLARRPVEVPAFDGVPLWKGGCVLDGFSAPNEISALGKVSTSNGISKSDDFFTPGVLSFLMGFSLGMV